MLTRWQLAATVVLCGLASVPALGALEGSPEVKKRQALAIQLQAAIAEHAASAQEAVEAITEAFLFGDKVAFCDVLMALDAQLESDAALENQFHQINSFRERGTPPLQPPAELHEKMVSARERHLAATLELEEKVTTLVKARRKGAEVAKLMTSYREAAEILVARRLGSVVQGPAAEAERRATVEKLLVIRLASNQQAFDATSEALAAGGDVALGNVLMAINAQLEIELALAKSREEKVAAYEKRLARSKHVEEQVAALRTAGKRGPEIAKLMKSYRQAAELNVALVSAPAAAEGSPEREAIKKLLADRAASVHEAVDAASNAFAAGDDVTLADVLMAIRAQFEAESSGVDGFQTYRAAHLNYIASARQFETKVNALSKARLKGEEAAKLAKSFRESTEIRYIEMQLNLPL